MSSLNKVQLIGNLGADPETRTFESGGKVCNFRIATSQKWTDKNTGEKRERTEWHSVAVFNDRLADIASQYLKKGSKVYVEGQLETRKWQDQSGQDRYTTEVVIRPYGGSMILLGERGDGSSARNASQEDAYRNGPGSAPPPSDGYGAGGQPGPSVLDDEIPFAPETRA